MNRIYECEYEGVVVVSKFNTLGTKKRAEAERLLKEICAFRKELRELYSNANLDTRSEYEVKKPVGEKIEECKIAHPEYTYLECVRAVTDSDEKENEEFRKIESRLDDLRVKIYAREARLFLLLGDELSAYKRLEALSYIEVWRKIGNYFEAVRKGEI